MLDLPCYVVPGHPAKKRVGRVDVDAVPLPSTRAQMGELVPLPNGRRRSSTGRAATMPLKELHAVAGHLQRLLETSSLTDPQDRFLKACYDALAARNEGLGALERCHCRMCLPAAPMGGGRRQANSS